MIRPFWSCRRAGLLQMDRRTEEGPAQAARANDPREADTAADAEAIVD